MALAVHYIKEHNGCESDLSFDILTIQPNAHRRKIYEAMFIYQQEPEINLRDELKNVEKFLIVSP